MKKKLGWVIVLLMIAGLISMAMLYFSQAESAKKNAIKLISSAIDARPAKIKDSYLFAGGLCKVESVNGQTESSQIDVKTKTSLDLYGWVITESTGRTLPPMVFGILSGEGGVFWLEGARVHRADVGAVFGSHYFDQGGFIVKGLTPSLPLGKYKLSVATGNEYVMGVCLTDKVININQ